MPEDKAGSIRDLVKQHGKVVMTGGGVGWEIHQRYGMLRWHCHRCGRLEGALKTADVALIAHVLSCLSTVRGRYQSETERNLQA